MLNNAHSALSLLSSRRSATVKSMGEPGPTSRQLLDILTLAIRVPDHGKLAPWRFVVFEGQARADFGRTIARRWRDLNPDTSDEAVTFWQNFFLRAPTVVTLISRARTHPKIPEWEQVLSAGAVGMALLLSATAMGVGIQWNTDWPAYDEAIHRAMKLEAFERVAGFFYFGTPTEPLDDRPRPDIHSLTIWWAGANE